MGTNQSKHSTDAEGASLGGPQGPDHSLDGQQHIVTHTGPHEVSSFAGKKANIAPFHAYSTPLFCLGAHDPAGLERARRATCDRVCEAEAASVQTTGVDRADGAPIAGRNDSGCDGDVFAEEDVSAVLAQDVKEHESGAGKQVVAMPAGPATSSAEQVLAKPFEPTAAVSARSEHAHTPAGHDVVALHDRLHAAHVNLHVPHWPRQTNEVTVFTFDVRMPAAGRSWKLRKTYNEFLALHASLRGVMAQALPDFPAKPGWLARSTLATPSPRDTHRLARRLHAYTSQVLDLPNVLSRSSAVRVFLELSATSLDPTQGWKGKEGYLLTPQLGTALNSGAGDGPEAARQGLQGQVYHCGPGFNCVPAWYEYWVQVRSGYIAVYESCDSVDPVHVMLLDQSFTVRPAPGMRVADCGTVGAACLPGTASAPRRHADTHLFTVESEAGTMLLKARDAKECDDWLLALSERASNAEAAQWAPLSSFAPPRRGSKVRWLVDGRNTFAAMLASLRSAEKEILLTGWWLSADMPMVREDERENAALFADSMGDKSNRVGAKASPYPSSVETKGLEALSAVEKGRGRAGTSGRGGEDESEGPPADASGLAILGSKGMGYKDAASFVLATAADAAGRARSTRRGSSGEHKQEGEEDADGQRAGEGSAEASSIRPAATAAPVSQSSSQSTLTQLKEVLRERAAAGVKIRILMYQEVEAALPLNSAYQKRVLAHLHPNIAVMRHGSWFWSHHEKIVCVDRQVAFVGGLDIAWGRWDTGSHVLDDPDRRILAFGVDYYNAAFSDYAPPTVDQIQPDRFDRSRFPRMPWHDVHLSLRGPAVADVARHFVQRWNFTRVDKAKYHLPVLLPFPSFEMPRRAQEAAAEGRGIATVSTQTSFGSTGIDARVPRMAQRAASAVAAGGAVGRDPVSAPPPVPRPLSLAQRDKAMAVGPCSGPSSWKRLPTATTEWYCSTDWTQHWHGSSVQVLRSAGRWSAGVGTECSIFHAYVHAILNAKHSIYIENQYILSSLGWSDEEQLQFEFAVGTGSGDMRARAAVEGKSTEAPVGANSAEAGSDVPSLPPTAHPDPRWAAHEVVRAGEGATPPIRGSDEGGGTGKRDDHTHALHLRQLFKDAMHRVGGEHRADRGGSRGVGRVSNVSRYDSEPEREVRPPGRARTRLRDTARALAAIPRGRFRRAASAGDTPAQAQPALAGSTDVPQQDARSSYAHWFAAQHQPARPPKRSSPAADKTRPAVTPEGGGGAAGGVQAKPAPWNARQEEAVQRITAAMQARRSTVTRDAAPAALESRVQAQASSKAMQEPLFGESSAAMLSPSSGGKERWSHAMVVAAQMADYSAETGAPAVPLPATAAVAPAPAGSTPSRDVSSLLESSGGVMQWDPARNSVFEALFIRLCRAIEDREVFCVSILLPLHPDGPVRISRAIQLVLHWEQCTIGKGPHSLLGRLAMKYPGVDLTRYINFVALRNHSLMRNGVLTTEIVYVHSKIMIVDDRVAIIGSANINDRSMYGDRDSEIAVLVSGGDRVLTRMAGKPWRATSFAHTLRRNLMEEHLGVAHTCDMFSVGSKGRGAGPAGAGSGPHLPTFRVDNAHACGTPLRLVAPTDQHRVAAGMPTRGTGMGEGGLGVGLGLRHAISSASLAVAQLAQPTGQQTLEEGDRSAGASVPNPGQPGATVSAGYAGAPYHVQTEESRATGLGIEARKGVGDGERCRGHATSRSTLLIPAVASMATEVAVPPRPVPHQISVQDPATPASVSQSKDVEPGMREGSCADKFVQSSDPENQRLVAEALASKDGILTVIASLEGSAGCEPVAVLQARRRDGVRGDACACDALLDPAGEAYALIWMRAAQSNARIYATVFPGAIQDDIGTIAEWRQREALLPRHPELLNALVGKLVAWPARFLHDENLSARPGEVEYLLPSKVTQ